MAPFPAERRAIRNKKGGPKGLLAAVGAWACFQEIDELVKEIYPQRGTAQYPQRHDQ